MALYNRNSGLTWPQYLKSQSFADDVKQGIRRAGKAMSSKIDEQTEAIVYSNEKLEQVFSSGLELVDSTLQAGLDQANETLQNGFERMEYGLDKIAGGIEGLRSDFNWAMSGLLHKLDIQNLLLKDIYVELRIPDFQKERRYYVEQGCKHYTNGLYKESLESFVKAEPLEKTDPFVLYSIGQIYLYQPNMVDMDKAQDYFTRAGKYYVAEKKNKPAGESYFHAGIAAYLRRDDVNAPLFAKKASELYPELLEAFYNYAKFLAVQGNDSGLSSLELAIRKDRNYALKVTADADFAGFLAQLQVLLDKLKREAKAEAGKAIADLEKELDEYVISDETIIGEINDLLNTDKVAALFNKDRYFDYLDYIIEVQSKQILLKEVSITTKELLTLEGHSSDVISVTFSPNGLILASLANDNIKLWDIRTGKKLHTLEWNSLVHGISLSFSPDGLMVASTYSTEHFVAIWNVQTGRRLQSLLSKVRDVAFSPDGLLLATTSTSEHDVKLWNVKTMELVHTLKGHLRTVYSITFSPDGYMLATGDSVRNGVVKLWDVGTGKELIELKGYYGCGANNIAFSSDGSLLAFISIQDEVKLWNIQKGKEYSTLNCSPRCIAFSPHGMLLACSNYRGEVELWDVQTGRRVLSLKGHSGIVNCVAFSPDGLMLASGSEDNAVKLWALEYKVITKAQLKRQEELRRKMNEVRRKPIEEQKHREEERLRQEQLQKQQEQWRSDGRCEVCGEPIGFSFTRKTRCKEHR